MAERTVLLVLVENRKETAVNVQKILTGWGCMIKTRLGIHDGVLDSCSNAGLLILELVGEKKKIEELTRKLSLLKNVSVKLVQLSLKAKKPVAKPPRKTVAKVAGKK